MDMITLLLIAAPVALMGAISKFGAETRPGFDERSRIQ